MYPLHMRWEYPTQVARVVPQTQGKGTFNTWGEGTIPNTWGGGSTHGARVVPSTNGMRVVPLTHEVRVVPQT